MGPAKRGLMGLWELEALVVEAPVQDQIARIGAGQIQEPAQSVSLVRRELAVVVVEQVTRPLPGTVLQEEMEGPVSSYFVTR